MVWPKSLPTLGTGFPVKFANWHWKTALWKCKSVVTVIVKQKHSDHFNPNPPIVVNCNVILQVKADGQIVDQGCHRECVFFRLILNSDSRWSKVSWSSWIRTAIVASW